MYSLVFVSCMGPFSLGEAEEHSRQTAVEDMHSSFLTALCPESKAHASHAKIIKAEKRVKYFSL